MRFSVFAALSALAALASVNALPVGEWKRTYSENSPAPSSIPTHSVICCTAPGVPAHCTECHSHSATTHAHSSTAKHEHHSVTTSAHPKPTAPPSCCTSPGVPAGCTECHPHNARLSARTDQSALQLAQKQPAQFLSQYVFQSLLVDEFKFGKGTSGKIDGSNMISQYVVVPAGPGSGSNQLAIHLNCVVTASALQNNVITINVEQFHLTARSVVTQKKIDASGPSAATAAQSIHINVNTNWGGADNLNALAQEIGIDANQAVHEVGSQQGYNNPYVRSLVNQFKTKVQLAIQQLLGGNVSVKWQGDKTFPA